MNVLWVCIIFFINYIDSSDRSSTQIITGTGSFVRMMFNIEHFSRIFASVGKVQLDPELENNIVTVEGQRNVIDQLAVTNWNNTLYIGLKDPSVKLNSNFTISVGIKDYLNLSLAGNAFYRFITKIKRPSFDLELAGQAQCDMDCDVEQLAVKMSGNSKLGCTGKADFYDVLMYGNVVMDVSKLEGQLNRAIKSKDAKLINTLDLQ